MAIETTEKQAEVSSEKGNGVGPVSYTGPDHELFELLLAKLQSYQKKLNLENLVVGFSSCDRGVGTSTLACQIALKAAEQRHGRVLLIDANETHSTIHRFFGVHSAPGLSDLVSSGQRHQEFVQRVPGAGMDLMTCGSQSDAARSQRSLGRVRELFTELRQGYALIVLDLPPLESGGAMVYASQCDGQVVVLKAGQTRKRRLRPYLLHLEENTLPVIGTVLNQNHRSLPKWLERWF